MQRLARSLGTAAMPWWLRLRLGLGTSPLDLFAFPFGVQHTKLLARPYPVINPALRATVTGLTGNFLPTPAAAIMRSVRMYLLRLDGEPHASATYMKTRSRTVSMSPSRSGFDLAQGARAPAVHASRADSKSCRFDASGRRPQQVERRARPRAVSHSR